jgi:hypothetical protein
VLVFLASLCLLASLGCSTDQSVPAGQSDASVSVTISPGSTAVRTGTSEQFQAEVTGTSNVGVTWWVDGLDGGSPALGFINEDGLYTAPGEADPGMHVTVMARSNADPSKSGSAQVEIIPVPLVTVSPLSPHVAAGARKQFSASAINVVDAGVIWSVDGVVGGTASSGTITDGGLYTAPLSARSATVTATSLVDASAASSTHVSVLAPHPIGVRSAASGIREFFDRSSGATVRPRGNNYIRLAGETTWANYALTAHSTFNTGRYDSNRAEMALAAMESRGYTMVRVFLNDCCSGSMVDDAGALSPTYLDNLIDFLGRARDHAISVLLTLDLPPSLGPYSVSCPEYPAFDYINFVNLCPGGVAASIRFHTALVEALIDHGAPLEAVFAYELQNEYYNDSAYAPLSWTSGTVTTANGQTYDMADAGSRQQMMDDGLIYSTNAIAAALRELDPTGLVTVGFFWPQAPNPSRVGDERVIEVYPAFASTTADFVDLHLYPVVAGLTLPQLVENFGYTPYLNVHPVLMGETGAFVSAYDTAADAAAGLKQWQISSCDYHFNGWLLWTWDTDEQPELWNGLSAGGGIDKALAPQLRPDPCAP